MKKRENFGIETDETAENVETAEKSADSGADTAATAGEQNASKKKFNVVAVLGFGFSVLGAIFAVIYAVAQANSLLYAFLACFVAGIVLGITGTVLSKKWRSGKWFGIFAIIIGALGIIAFSAFFIIIVLIFTSIGKG